MRKAVKTIKFTTTLESASNGSGWHFIIVSREMGERFPTDGKSRRVVCTLNGRHSYQCALMPNDGKFYIIVNKKIRESLGVVSGDKLKVSLVPDESKYGLPMSKEFKEVLKQDREGNRLFHALTPGKQRTLIYYISKIKDIDKRIHTALIVLDHLKENEGRVIFPELADELKRPVY
jgi:hypothetical protein